MNILRRWSSSITSEQSVSRLVVGVSEPVHDLQYLGATPSVMLDKLAEKVRFKSSPTERRIIVAGGISGSCAGSISVVTVSNGSIVMRLDFLVITWFPMIRS